MIQPEGIPTFPVCLLRGYNLQNVYTAASVGCGENGLGVNANLFAYADRVISCWSGASEQTGTHVCQCLTMAGVDSMMVPSISKRNPSKETCIGACVYCGCEPMISCGGSC